MNICNLIRCICTFSSRAGTTEVTQSTIIIPSVEIVALDVHFQIIDDVKTLPAFIKCFPNIKTLHIKVKLIVNIAPRYYIIRHFASMPPPPACLHDHIMSPDY